MSDEEVVEAEKHADRSEPLAALVLQAKAAFDPARAEVERAREAAAEAAAAAAAAEAAAAAAYAQKGDETLCVVCVDAVKDHAMVPCGHICVCGPCSKRLPKATCPVCRADVSCIIKTYR